MFPQSLLLLGLIFSFYSNRLQIALAIIICLCIPILFFCNFVTRPLLQVLSYPEIVIENAVLFTRVASVGFIPQSIFMGMQQYLQAIDVNTPVTIILLIAISVDIGLNVLLVWGVGSWNGLGFVVSERWTMDDE